MKINGVEETPQQELKRMKTNIALTLAEFDKHVPETPIEKLKKGDRIIIDGFSNLECEGRSSFWEFGKFVRLNNDGTFIARPIDFDDKRKYLKEETFKNKQYFGRV